MELENTDVYNQESEVNTAGKSNTQETAEAQEYFNIDEVSQKLRHLAQDLNLNLSNPVFQSADSAEGVKLLLKYVTLTRALLAKRSAAKCQKYSVTSTPAHGITETADQTQTKLDMTSQSEYLKETDDDSTENLFGKMSFDFLQSTENSTTDFSSQTQIGNNAYMPDHLSLQNIPEDPTLPYNSELRKDTGTMQPCRIQTQSVQDEDTENSREENSYFSNQLMSPDRVSDLRIHRLPNNNGPQQRNSKLSRKFSDTSNMPDIPAKVLKLMDIGPSSEPPSSHLIYSAPWDKNNRDSGVRTVGTSSKQAQQHSVSNSENKFPNISSESLFQTKIGCNSCQDTSLSNLVSTDLIAVSQKPCVTQNSISNAMQKSASGIMQSSTSNIMQSSTTDIMQSSTSGVMQGSASGVMQSSASGAMQGSTSGIIQNSISNVMENSISGVMQNFTDDIMQNSSSGAIQGSTSGDMQGSTSGAMQASTSSAMQGSISGVMYNSINNVIQNSTSGVVQSSASGVMQNSTSGVMQNSTSSVMQNSNDSRTTNKSKRYNKTADALKRSGLMEVTMKTAELLQRNRSLQKEIDNLKKESALFLKDVLQNPENERIKDSIMHSLPTAN